MKKTAIIVVAVTFLAGCAISENVVPVDSDKTIEKVYVRYSDDVHMEGLNDELVSQFRSLGFDAELYRGDTPDAAQHTFIFTANWAWDLAMYLTYFHGTLYEEGRMLGEAEYDARSGGSNFGKFGPTASKIKPLLTEMMQKVQRR
ncbi:Sbal_3080 family lipoprotein [Wenzhouxiangella sediminis]|uniref:DUF4136 domain-containing protein n=1 Tax=Wenzhouxiangella sediminis TaxID=1792836 RepID=A0A3E1K7J4_9GAMM|nr:Sbal_3080 family lipoprotein [Wenzhouxiangella sediminis]RFF29953.1 hypothetical protein DZC52_11015 [Wenzhouxiangella sediminis]